MEGTSIVLIEGGAGSGKTTLALQIAGAVAANPKGEGATWCVNFLSLEQTPGSLLNVVKNFGFGDRWQGGVFPDQANCNTPELGPRRVLFSRLSPLPLSDHQAEATFEIRFAELEHMIKEQEHFVGREQDSAKGFNSLFVIDSLNAFLGHLLSRSQLYQLFTLFRTKQIPLIVTLERPEIAYSTSAAENETACFLADIVIKLTRHAGPDYLQTFLEVSKSRVCLQSLGKHLYKTRTKEDAVKTGAPLRTGLVVYPSVHFIIQQARLEEQAKLEKQAQQEADARPIEHTVVGQEPDELLNQTKRPSFLIAPELKELLVEEEIEPRACFALQGPAGTHKLALGLNLGISYVDNKAKLLIVTFGGQGDINFGGVAWVTSQAYLWKLKKKKQNDTGPREVVEEGLGRTQSTRDQPPRQEPPVVQGTKQRVESYEASDGTKSAEVTVLTFQIGVLTPEECIYKIRLVLDEEEKMTGMPFQSVLLSDTAELCTGFPLLSRDPMFFATLLDLFETKGMLTVGLGVHSADTPSLREINLTLMARATHRMLFYHFPTVEGLMESMVKSSREARDEPGERPKPVFEEQLVSVVVDIVTGKHYKRQPKWIWIDERPKTDPPDRANVLGCKPFDEPRIQLIPPKQRAAPKPVPASEQQHSSSTIS